MQRLLIQLRFIRHGTFIKGPPHRPRDATSTSNGFTLVKSPTDPCQICKNACCVCVQMMKPIAYRVVRCSRRRSHDCFPDESVGPFHVLYQIVDCSFESHGSSM